MIPAGFIYNVVDSREPGQAVSSTKLILNTFVVEVPSQARHGSTLYDIWLS